MPTPNDETTTAAAATVTITRDLADRLHKHMATLTIEARNEDWVNKDEIRQAWAELNEARYDHG